MNLLQKIFKISSRPRTKYPVPENSGREFYLLECWKQYANLSPELLPYVDRIKTKEEWEKAGFSLEFNRFGHIRKVKIGNRYFSFIKVDSSEKLEAEAIRKGKRLTQNPEHIELLIQQGCQPDEFIFYSAQSPKNC